MRIAIVGCGVAGLTSALLLARGGCAVTLFEQAPHIGPVGAGVLLQPSGQLVLERLGLLAEVASQAEPIERLYAQTHRGRTLIDLPYGEIFPGCRAYGLHRGDLFEVLHRAVAACGVPLVLGCSIACWERDGDHVILLDEAGGRHGPFDVLLGADGARSRLRARAGLRLTAREYPHGALWVLGRSTSVQGRLYQVCRGTSHLCGLLPMGQGRCSLFWSLRKEQFDAVRERGLGPLRDEILRLMPAAVEVLDGVAQMDELRFTTYLRVRMERWHDDRCLFLGDAAHAMSPHLGQGINLALIDAFVLSGCLLSAPTPAAAFARYDEIRGAHVRFYAFLTYVLSPFFQSRGMLKGVLRDLFLPLLPRLPLLRRAILLSMAGLKAGFFGGRFALPPAS